MNFDAIRTIIDRGHLPPRLTLLVGQLEAEGADLAKPSEAAMKELNQVSGLVDGQLLLQAIVATAIDAIPAELLEGAEAEAEAQVKQALTPAERYDAALKALEPDTLMLLKIEGFYYAFDHHAEQLAAPLNEHLFEQSRRKGLALNADKQAQWQTTLVDEGVDVTLVEEDDEQPTGYATVSLLDAATAND